MVFGESRRKLFRKRWPTDYPRPMQVVAWYFAMDDVKRSLHVVQIVKMQVLEGCFYAGWPDRLEDVVGRKIIRKFDHGPSTVESQRRREQPPRIDRWLRRAWLPRIAYKRNEVALRFGLRRPKVVGQNMDL